MNKKGFIISTTLYSIFGIMLITIATILFVLVNNRNIVKAGISDIQACINCGYVCEQNDENAIPDDTSNANEPKLANGMIPVIYDFENRIWIKSSTERNVWYNYDAQMWANAVTVASSNSSKYKNAEIGTPIPMTDIKTMWVWIPRFKYRITEKVETGLYKVDVVFEEGTKTSGVTQKAYKAALGSTDGVISSGTYYTHPAFRDGDKIEYDSSSKSKGAWDEDITGMWVGKFASHTYGGEIKPDIQYSEPNNFYHSFETSLKYAGGTISSSTGKITFSGNSVSGITGTSSDTHMMKNIEWGAVLYLAYSKYGKMGNTYYDSALYNNNRSSHQISENNSGYQSQDNTYITGRSEGVTESGKSCVKYASETRGCFSYNDYACPNVDKNICDYVYVENSGQAASTTGTIYGVYDMNGTTTRVAANVYGLTGYTTNGSGSGWTDNYFKTIDPKYFDSYDGGDSNKVRASINKNTAILGDATWEFGHTITDELISLNNNKTKTPWIYRSIGTLTTIEFNAGEKGSIPPDSFRTVLIP